MGMVLFDGISAETQIEWEEKCRNALAEHIEHVYVAGINLGIPAEQMQAHDASKYSEEEFRHYARRFYGDDADPDGFAHAWLHHVHNNPHHWQYWIFPDFYMPDGDTTVEYGVMRMPDNYALEMLADWQGASMVYDGTDDMTDWLSHNIHRITLHTETAKFVTAKLTDLGYGMLFNGRQFLTRMHVRHQVNQ